MTPPKGIWTDEAIKEMEKILDNDEKITLHGSVGLAAIRELKRFRQFSSKEVKILRSGLEQMLFRFYFPREIRRMVQITLKQADVAKDAPAAVVAGGPGEEDREWLREEEIKHTKICALVVPSPPIKCITCEYLSKLKKYMGIG